MEFSSVNQRSTVGSGVLNPCLEPVLQPSLLKRCWKGSFMPSECRKGLHFLCAENVCFLGQPLTILRVRAAPKTPVKNRILNLISRTVFVAFQKTEWAKIWWMKYFQHVSSFKEGGKKSCEAESWPQYYSGRGPLLNVCVARQRDSQRVTEACFTS